MVSPNAVNSPKLPQCAYCGITFDKDGTLADDHVCPNVDGSKLKMAYEWPTYDVAFNKQIPSATISFQFVLFDGDVVAMALLQEPQLNFLTLDSRHGF